MFPKSLKYAMPALCISLLAVAAIVLNAQLWSLLLSLLAIAMWALAVHHTSRRIDVAVQGRLIGEVTEINHTVSNIFSEEYSHIEEHLARIVALTHEATGLLQNSTEQLNDLLRKQCRITQLLIETNSSYGKIDVVKTDGNSGMELSATNDAMIQEIHNAIRALQFEDLVAQLVDSVRQRLEHLAEVSRQADSELALVENRQQLQAVVARLQAIRCQFDSDALHSKVRQQSLSEGDIELF